MLRGSSRFKAFVVNTNVVTIIDGKTGARQEVVIPTSAN